MSAILKLAASQYRSTFTRGGTVVLYPGKTSDAGIAEAPNGQTISTTGTTTAGIQESLDFAGQNYFDWRIEGGNEPGGVGGWGGAAVVFNVHEPVAVPPMQGKRVSSGAVTINFTNELGTTPGLVFDSMMMCHVDFRAAQIVYQSTGPYGLVLRPQLPVPVDNFAAIVDSKFFFQTVGPTVLFDNTYAGIAGNEFKFAELNASNLEYGIVVFSASAYQFRGNWVECPHIHGTTNAAILVGATSPVASDLGGNIWKVGLSTEHDTSRGIITHATADQYHISIADGTNSGGSTPQLIFDTYSSQCQVFMGASQYPFYYQDKSYKRNNRVYVERQPVTATITATASPMVIPSIADSLSGMSSVPQDLVTTGGTVSKIELGSVRATYTVSGVTSNAGTIRVATGSAHGMTTGDSAIIADVAGVTAANGQWVVTVINATTIDLQGSTFSGSYTSGGVVSAMQFVDTGVIAGPLHLDAGRFERVTYSVAPTIKRII